MRSLLVHLRRILRLKRRVGAHRTTSTTSGGPAVHRGADLSYGRELRAMGQMEVAPELVSDIEKELEWGLIWHDLEHRLKAEVDRIFAPALAFAEIETFDQLRELVLA